MITQSPESDMLEPYLTYVRQRSEALAEVIGSVVGNNVDVQLCPRAITEDEQLFGNDGLLYGVVVGSYEDGYKSVLYRGDFNDEAKKLQGLFTSDVNKANTYISNELSIGNRVRLKDPKESDGNGQYTVETVEDGVEIFNQIKASSHGVVLMPHVCDFTHKISVGHINLGQFGVFEYLGVEENTVVRDRQVYGGTSIGLFDVVTDRRSLVEAKLEIPSHLSLAGIRAIGQYYQVAKKVGRVSVDVIEGYTDNGTKLASVIDITPRVGGVSPAEVLAIRELADGSGFVCFSSSRLIFDPVTIPKTGKNFIETSTLIINAYIDEVI